MKKITMNSPITAIKWPTRFKTVINDCSLRQDFPLSKISDIYKRNTGFPRGIRGGYISGLMWLRGIGVKTLKEIDVALRFAGLPSILVLGPRKKLENMSMFFNILRQAEKAPKTTIVWRKGVYSCGRCKRRLGDSEDLECGHFGNFCPDCGATFLTKKQIASGELNVVNPTTLEYLQTHGPDRVPLKATAT